MNEEEIAYKTDVEKRLYKDDEFNEVHLLKNGNLRICTAGKCAEQPIEMWVYEASVLQKRVTEAIKEIEVYDNGFSVVVYENGQRKTIDKTVYMDAILSGNEQESEEKG